MTDPMQAGVSRRDVLVRGTALAGIAMAAGVVGWRGLTNRPGELTLADFSPQLGTWFDIHAGGTGRLRLLEASPSTVTGQNGARYTGEAFSLLFGGAPANGTVTLSHPALGSFPLFVSPVGRDTNGPHVEAVVNRWRVGP